MRLEVLTEPRYVEGIVDRAAVVADLGTSIVRVAKAGSIIIAHPDLSMVTHAERLDGMSAGYNLAPPPSCISLSSEFAPLRLLILTTTLLLISTCVERARGRVPSVVDENQ